MPVQLSALKRDRKSEKLEKCGIDVHVHVLVYNNCRPIYSLHVDLIYNYALDTCTCRKQAKAKLK